MPGFDRSAFHIDDQPCFLFGTIVPEVFTPVLAKHTKSFSLIDTLAVGVDRIQRSFEPLRRQVEEWRQAQISDERAKLILCTAFVDGKLEAPRSLLPGSPSALLPTGVRGILAVDNVKLSNAFPTGYRAWALFGFL